MKQSQYPSAEPTLSFSCATQRCSVSHFRVRPVLPLSRHRLTNFV